jgi:hypothetical protein
LQIFDGGSFLDCFFYVFNKTCLHVDFFDCGAYLGFVHYRLDSGKILRSTI